MSPLDQERIEIEFMKTGQKDESIKRVGAYIVLLIFIAVLIAAFYTG